MTGAWFGTKDYSDEIAQDIKDRVSAWIDKFEESQEYLSLSASVGE
jgi:hypothetical protein